MMTGVAAVAAAFLSASAAPADTRDEPGLEEVRALTAKYQDVKVALAEGFVRDPGNMCDTADMMGRPKELGAMGIHFFRPTCSAFQARPTRA
jgi:hypothetical protein